jgi:hypothetical protein
MATPGTAPEEASHVHVTLGVNGTQAAASGQLVSCDVSLHAMPSPWQAQRPVGDVAGDEGEELRVGGGSNSENTGAVEALKAARTDIQGLREERAAMVAQVTTSESRCVAGRVAGCVARLPALTVPLALGLPPQPSSEPVVCHAGSGAFVTLRSGGVCTCTALRCSAARGFATTSPLSNPPFPRSCASAPSWRRCRRSVTPWLRGWPPWSVSGVS